MAPLQRNIVIFADTFKRKETEQKICWVSIQHISHTDLRTLSCRFDCDSRGSSPSKDTVTRTGQRLFRHNQRARCAINRSRCPQGHTMNNVLHESACTTSRDKLKIGTRDGEGGLFHGVPWDTLTYRVPRPKSTPEGRGAPIPRVLLGTVD